MITRRPAGERGVTRTSWLDSRHTFSFNNYYDPRHTSWSSLRVINEDWVKGGAGFPTHGHSDMEIITYVLSGALAHKDSSGGEGLIRPGEVQRMSAGTGIRHSEANASETDIVHLLQIWILPERRGLQPGYEQRSFAPEERRGRFRLVASRDGREGSVTIHQDAALHVATLAAGEAASYEFEDGRNGWLQVARGVVSVNDQTFEAGDGAGISDERNLRVVAQGDVEILLFDLA